MNKTIQVLTQNGLQKYQVALNGKQYRVTLQQEGQLRTIGRARVQDDAMLIIRDHATAHFGGVKQVKIY